jgi:hypothetical protein
VKFEAVEQAKEYADKVGTAPEIGVIMGSGPLRSMKSYAIRCAFIT